MAAVCLTISAKLSIFSSAFIHCHPLASIYIHLQCKVCIHFHPGCLCLGLFEIPIKWFWTLKVGRMGPLKSAKSTDLRCYSNLIGGFSVQANKYSPKPQLWVFWNQLKEIDLQQQCMCELAQLLINHNTLLLPRFCSKMLKSEEEECIQRCLPIFRHFSPISSSRFLTTKWETESPGHLSVNICWALKKLENTCIAICSP